jgi:acyl-CoA thioester hydrolase
VPAVSGPFIHRFRVRYAECDAQGVVFNAHYVTYFDTTITELWREAFGSYAAMLESGTDMVVAEVRVRYRGPARFDDELDVGAEVVRLGTTSMTTRFTVTRAGEEAMLTEGEVRHVFVDPATKVKKPIPHDVRRRLEPYCTPQAASAA